MNQAAISAGVKRAGPRTRAMILGVIWSGWGVSVFVVLLAAIAVEATPHARGISFFLPLRFAIVTPACIIVSIAAAFLYRAVSARAARPRLILAIVIAGLACLLLLVMRVTNPRSAVVLFPTLLTVAVVIALLVPRFVDRPRRSLIGIVAIAVLGALEIMGVIAAFSSERIATPSSPALAFEIPRTMFDVDHKFVDLPGGVRVHYVDEGKGETILFLHGNLSWSFQWRDLIHNLRGSYRCVALDYPGFGLSTAPHGFGFTPREESLVVEEFVDHLGLRNITLVMQDWGGPIGLAFAERRPELVRRIVLGSTWAWPTGKSEPRGTWSVIAGGPVGEFIEMNFDALAPWAIKQSIVRKLPADVIDVYARPFRPLDRRGIAVFYPEQITAATHYFEELEAGLPRLIEKKALIFWALQDPGFPRTDLARFEKAFPKHRTIEFPNANHFFFEDEADEMVLEIRAFMASDRSHESLDLPRTGGREVQRSGICCPQNDDRT